MPRTTLGSLGRVVAVIAVAALASPALTSAHAATPSTRQLAQRTSATTFAFHGWAFGTDARGGSVPASSGPTAYQAINCGNLAGIVRTNRIADATIPSLGSANGADTRIWTTKSNGTVSTWSRNTLDKVTLSDSSMGSLVLSNIATTARAFHDARGYHSYATVDLGRLQFKPAMGPAQDFRAPKPGQSVTIPGFARVTMAGTRKVVSSRGSLAYGNGVKVEMLASGSVVRIARAVAQIEGGLISGVFGGNSYGIDGKAGGSVVRLGKNPLLPMPCVGTHGRVRTRSLATLDLGGQVVAQGMQDAQAADQDRRRAWGWERSTVSSFSLGGDQLVIKGIVGRAAAVRKGTGMRTLIRRVNTQIGSLEINGTSHPAPSQTMTIPGVAKLEPRVVTRMRTGVKVIALRVTLLDGSGAVINLGNATIRIRHLQR